MFIRLAKEGLRELAISTVVLVGTAAVVVWLCRAAWYGWAIASVPTIVWLWVLWFFRDPDRVTPPEPGLFVSSADGVVSDITPVGAESDLGCPGVRIGVFMSLFNVHVNRAACDGRVVVVRHDPGEFLDVRFPTAWDINESVTIRLDYDAGGVTVPVVIRQVAGLVARRIVCHARPGDSLVRGRRFGMIKFGSRLELHLPDRLGAQIRVSIGQKVQAGVTVLPAIPPARERR
jgi:phosphatidylserine decarboxylase